MALWLAWFLVFPTLVRADERQLLRGHVPAAAARVAPIGRMPQTQRLDLAIGLPLRNRDALTTLLQQLYDPASTNYHRYLTSAQFAEMFGPTEADYQAVKTFAQAQGLTIQATHPNRTLLDVSGTVADVERAFQVTMRVYPHPTEPRNFYAPDTEPSLGLAVPLIRIDGLDNLVTPHPCLRVVPLDQAADPRPQAGSASGLYIGNDFRAAYVPGVALNGTGQAVGLFELDGYFPSDITTYEANANLPSVTLTNVLVNGASGSAGTANTEVALDIDMAISMAPGLSSVIVYEGPSSGTTLANINNVLNRMATDNLAKQLSSSWAWNYSPNSTTEQIFAQYAAQGQSFFNASGDSGAYTGAIWQPSDDPSITIVGGTALSTTGGGGAWTSETTWTGSSGGISLSYAIPSWQQGINMTTNQGSTTHRNIPDVAMCATNIYLIANNGTAYLSWGTSAAAPLWAGFIALVNQQAAANGLAPVGFLNPAIYNLAMGANYASCFHDITTGNNANSGSAGKFPAVPGFDLCTGWGTPAGSSLINALAGTPAPAVVSNGLALLIESCPNGLVDPGETVTMNFSLKNVGAINTTNLIATLQTNGGVSSPGDPQSYGALVAGGGAVSKPFTFTTAGSCGGVVTATLLLQDGATSLNNVTFAIPLGALVTTTPLLQSFDSVTPPALPSGWTTTTSGAQSAWVTSAVTSDTAPNAAFSAEPAGAGVNELVTPPIPIASSSARLTFRHSYNLQASTHSTSGYDGGVLEVALGGGSFTDILKAGGSFVSGGYTRTISNSRGNPLAGRQAWSGSSGGFVTSTVSLPAAAAGQNIQFKWRCGTDTNTSGSGWYVDTVSISESVYTCCTPSTDLAIGQTASPSPAIVGKPLGYTLAITNLGSTAAASVTFTDALPGSVTFVSASPGCTNIGGTVVCTLGALSSGASSNFSITVVPTAGGLLTNLVTVASATPDPNPSNNTATTAITANAPPAITNEPSGQVVVAGGMTAFKVMAAGTAPLNYQWTLGGTNLANAIAATLLLTNIQLAQAGNYAVVVTNMAGAITSGVASLRVLVPPQITGITLAGNGVSISLTSVSSLNYTLEYKNSLTDPAWTPLPPPIPGAGPTLILEDPNAVIGTRFYRVRCE